MPPMPRKLPILLVLCALAAAAPRPSSANEVKALVTKALEAHSKGDLKGAIKHMEQAAVAAPGETIIGFKLGALYLEAGQLESARSAFEGVLKKDPEHHDARFNLAKLLSAMGRHAEAAQHMGQAIRRNKADPQLPMELAAIHLAAGHNDAARTVLENITPRTPAVLSFLAFLALRSGDADSAIAHARAAFKGEPLALRHRLTLATALVHGLKFGEAETLLDNLARTGPRTQANIPYLQGLAAFLSGDLGAARRWLREADSRAPGMFDPANKGFDALFFPNENDRSYLAWAKKHPGAPRHPEPILRAASTSAGCLPGHALSVLLDKSIALQRCFSGQRKPVVMSFQVRRGELVEVTGSPRGKVAGCLQTAIAGTRLAQRGKCSYTIQMSTGR